MCLAIPARVVELGSNMSARVDIMGLSREISTRLTPDVQVGDYLLVHAGYSINIITEAEALETLSLIEQFPELACDEAEALHESESAE